MTDAETASLVAEYDQARTTLPPAVTARLKAMVVGDPAAGIPPEFAGIEPAKIKAIFISKLKLPAVQAQNEGKYIVALRATVAELNGLLASQNYDFDFLPVTLPGKPIAPKDEPDPKKQRKTDWRIRMFGLAQCIDPKSPFEGPATIIVYNFADEVSAARESARFQTGHVYRMRAKISEKSSKGKMGMGQIGFLNGTAAEPTREVPQANGGVWPSPFARIAECVPPSLIANLLTKPEKYATYLIEGDVTTGRLSSGPNGMFGNLVVTDDSVTGAVRDQFKGGISLFLAKNNLSLTKLAVGSRVRAIVSGYPAKKKDSQGNRTGDEVWNWNAEAIEVLLDLSSGTEIPDPTKVAVNIPAEQPGTTRDVM